MLGCLRESVGCFEHKLKQCIRLNGINFSRDPAVCTAYWDARKALIPMVGAVREAGTSVLLEDVAVPVQVSIIVCTFSGDNFFRLEPGQALQWIGGDVQQVRIL